MSKIELSEESKIIITIDKLKSVLNSLYKQLWINTLVFDKIGAAKNLNSSGKVLRNLADDDNHYVRWLVAKNPSCPIKAIEKLVLDRCIDVRYMAIRNPNCPTKVLEKLANDKDPGVRYWVAYNPNCPIKVLEKLSTDREIHVLHRVSQNFNCPEYIKTYYRARNYMSKYYEQV